MSPNHPSAPPIALSIAGSDCSAGAGIQADLKTFQYFAVHGLTAVTCVVSETANVVNHVHPIPPEVVADQTQLLLKSFPVAAIKTGMLFSTEIIEMVVHALKPYAHIPIVVDPVMIASTGDSLLTADAIEVYQKQLFPIASLLTPNLDEAEALLGKPISTASMLPSAAKSLFEKFGCPILLKGGHLAIDSCIDVLYDGSQHHAFENQRFVVPGSHGTGCTLSAAITAQLAHGETLPTAVQYAKNYLNQTLIHSYSLQNPPQSPIHALNQGTTLQD